MIDDEVKQKFLKELEKAGNVGVAAARVGIHRSTFYRWKEKDEEFRKKADEAEFIGRENNTDIAEHALMMNVKDRNQKAVEYQLSHNSPRYKHPMSALLKKFEDVFPEDGFLRFRKAMAIKKKFKDKPYIPLGYTHTKECGIEIEDTELEEYENYINEWCEKIFGKKLDDNSDPDKKPDSNT